MPGPAPPLASQSRPQCGPLPPAALWDQEVASGGRKSVQGHSTPGSPWPRPQVRWRTRTSVSSGGKIRGAGAPGRAWLGHIAGSFAGPWFPGSGTFYTAQRSSHRQCSSWSEKSPGGNGTWRASGPGLLGVLAPTPPSRWRSCPPQARSRSARTCPRPSTGSARRRRAPPAPSPPPSARR